MVIYGDKEMLWRDYRDPSKVGELDDGIRGFRWAYTATDDTPIREAMLRQKNEAEQRIAKFEDRFVDVSLESYTRDYIRDSAHYPEISAYLKKVLVNTPYERYVLEDIETFIETERRQVLEIILASKEKLTRAGANAGYPAEIYSNDRKLQLRCYAYAQTINLLMCDAGLSIMLNGDRDTYAWRGSGGDNRNLKPFSTKYIDPE